MFIGQVVADSEMLPDLLTAGITAGKIRLEFHSRLAEESPYDHVQLLQARALLSHIQETVQYQRDQQDLNGNKRHILKKIEEGVARSMEEMDLEDVEYRGQRNQGHA